VDHESVAVLFDMDGTLVDSEKVWTVGLHELAAHYGGVLSDDARLRMVGTSALETMVILHDDLRQPWRDPVAGADWLDLRMVELLDDGLEWLPGARELVAAVRADGIRTALVTNTRRMLVEVALRTLGRDTFDVVVCGDDVAATKPAPDPYRAAAAALGLDPGRCVAIEDSPAGVVSALAAGCAVVAVPHEVPVTGATVVVDSLLEIDVPALRRLIGRRRESDGG
jgi:HAD superfamily hydrolase (TIGR01509 family)